MRIKKTSIALFTLLSISNINTNGKEITQAKREQESINKTSDSLYSEYISKFYSTVNLEETGLSETVFQKALTGFYNLKYAGKLHSKSILTIADFDQESCKKRLYIIDIDNRKLLLNTWVAHGQNSGGDLPNWFSNQPNSNQSSLGFYLTAEIYNGKHGRSLKLDGLDLGFNDKARERSIVVHGADYVGQKSIDQLGRLGRSQGCPAVATQVANQVINTIADRTVLFINNSSQYYNSSYLNEQLAASYALKQEEVFASNMD